MGGISWGESLEDPYAVEASALERVIGVGQGRSIDGITVEFLALEIRTLGAFGLIRAEFPPEVHAGFDFLGPELAAADDIGTAYTVIVVGSEWVSAGPRANPQSRERFAIVPPIPRRARELHVRVVRFGGQRAGTLDTPEGSMFHLSEPSWIDGPWEFRISL